MLPFLPRARQKTLLAKAFGCARVVWNGALALNRQLYEEEAKPFDAGDLMKRCITRAKRSEERSWLAEPSRTMLQQSVRDLKRSRTGGKAKAESVPLVLRVGETVRVWVFAVGSFIRRIGASAFRRLENSS